MRILLVDDDHQNLDAWKKLLEHPKVAQTLWIKSKVSVDICSTFISAVDFLSQKKYDVVLTDMSMPVELSDTYRKRMHVDQVPYWYVIVSAAKELGVRNIAIVTDSSHHSDPVSSSNSIVERHWFAPTIWRSWFIIQSWSKSWASNPHYKWLDQLEGRLTKKNRIREHNGRPPTTEGELILTYTYVKALFRLLKK